MHIVISNLIFKAQLFNHYVTFLIKILDLGEMYLCSTPSYITEFARNEIDLSIEIEKQTLKLALYYTSICIKSL